MYAKDEIDCVRMMAGNTAYARALDTLVLLILANLVIRISSRIAAIVLVQLR